MIRVFLIAAAAAASQIKGSAADPVGTVTVNPDNHTHTVNKLFMGCHSDSGFVHEPRGFYSQLVFGESFEASLPDTAAAKGMQDLISIQNIKNGGNVRHCDFELYTCDPQNNPDFSFTEVAALDGTSGAVSFQSHNFPTKYLGLLPTKAEEPGRLGLIAINNAGDKASASFKKTAGTSGYSFESTTTPMSFMQINNHLQGSCSGGYHTPHGSDVIMGPVTDKEAATWIYTHPPPPPPPPPPPVYPWHNYVSEGVDATLKMDTNNSFHGSASQQITFSSGTGMAGVANRGLGSEGLFIQDGQEYDGFFFAKSDSSVNFTVALMDYHTNKTLGSAVVPFSGGNWTMLNFSITTTGGTVCVDGTNAPDMTCGKMGPASHICVECGGQFFVGLSSPGSANVDYVFLQPGEWGRFNGLQVLKSGVDILKEMGITAIRLGGSFTDPAYYFWKNWVGKPWERPSLGAEWGHELISGWGPFEFIDMCNAAGIEAIMTTTGVCPQCQPEDMGDLIDFTHGGADTEWGQKRISLGHPEPYNVTFFELGNEQYNPMYPEQVANMEARAAKLGMAQTMFYMNPNNANWLKPDDAAKVEAIGIKDHAVMDEHVGGGGGVELARQRFAAFPNYTMGAVNAETNAAIHTVARMMMEANDLIDWFNCAESWCSRLHFRTASFCTERSGHYDAFDQGISFFLPNMSWIQPPGYVHKMIGDTWADAGVDIAVSGQGVTATAQKSVDDTVYVRVASSVAGTVQLVVAGTPLDGSFTVTVLNGGTDTSAANPPGNPTFISPTTSTMKISGGSLVVGANSFTVISVPPSA